MQRRESRWSFVLNTLDGTVDSPADPAIGSLSASRNTAGQSDRSDCSVVLQEEDGHDRGFLWIGVDESTIHLVAMEKAVGPSGCTSLFRDCRALAVAYGSLCAFETMRLGCATMVGDEGCYSDEDSAMIANDKAVAVRDQFPAKRVISSVTGHSLGVCDVPRLTFHCSRVERPPSTHLGSFLSSLPSTMVRSRVGNAVFKIFIALGVMIACTSVVVSSWMSTLATLPDATAPHVPCPANETGVQPKSAHIEDTRICSVLKSGPALSLWMDHLTEIHRGSRLPRDKNFTQHDKLLQMLYWMTPRLPRSVKTTSRDYQLIENAINILQRRLDYLKGRLKQRPPPPPLKIVVLGGSVTLGNLCSTEMGGPCAWPYRLENFVNKMAGGGGPLIEVHNLGVGGTNTEIGIALLKYDAFPEAAKDPDILIQAYATNDMHAQTVTEAMEQGITLGQKGLDMAQRFIRTLGDLCTNKQPLLLWVDDYLGNEQRRVMDTTELSEKIQVLASYYGFSSLSYADAVRDWVYSDVKETMLSPLWHNEKGRFVREIHPGQGAHIAISYMVAYHLLYEASLYCSLESWNPSEMDKQPSDVVQAVAELPPMKRTEDQTPLEHGSTKPRSRPQLPPPLTDDLKLAYVSQMCDKQPGRQSCADSKGRPCSFAWISGLDDKRPTAEKIEKYFEPYVHERGIWAVRDATKRGKFGWCPPLNDVNQTEIGNLVLELPLYQKSTKIAVFFLKSYLPRYLNSTARIVISGREAADDWTTLSDFDLRGEHNKTTTEMYVEEFRLGEAMSKGASIRFNMTVSNGTFFNLMGLAICT